MNERHFPLVNYDVVLRRVELFVRNRIDVYGDVLRGLDALHADFAFDFVGPACPGHRQSYTYCDYCLCCYSL